jgi:hypothetical protein
VIHRPFLLVVAAALLVAAVGLGVERLVFLQRAKRTMGDVVDVDATNDRCGSNRRTRYACTRFSATVRFTPAAGETATHVVDAGDSRGHDMPVSAAKLHEGDLVPIVYDPSRPRRAYRGSGEVWSAPGIAVLGGVVTLIVALSPPRRRRVW